MRGKTYVQKGGKVGDRLRRGNTIVENQLYFFSVIIIIIIIITDIPINQLQESQPISMRCGCVFEEEGLNYLWRELYRRLLRVLTRSLRKKR